MAITDVMFQDIFKSYILPISAILLIMALFKVHIRRFFTRIKCNINIQISDIYNEATHQHKKQLFESIHRHSESLDRPMRILELGVEHGYNLQFYPGGCDIICLDQNPVFESYIRGHVTDDYPQLRLLEFMVGGGEVLSGMGEACLDAVVLTHALCCERDPMATIKEVYRILRPNGHFFIMEHTRAQKWSRLLFKQVLFQPFYLVLGIPCDIRRDLIKLIKSVPFRQVEHKTFVLELGNVGLSSRLLIPSWLRYQASGAAIK